MFSKMIGGDDSCNVVISGISGVFPNSENVQELKENLFAGNDMISASTRPYSKGFKYALLKNIDRFDYSFFRINYNQANLMIVASRLLLEKTFEAILDAGYNPQEIKGRNIAVICAVWDTIDEGDPTWDKTLDDYSEAIGRSIFMMPNRLSSFLDVHGPSYNVNTACSSSLYAIDEAVKAIRMGQCEGAIVCSANLCFTAPFGGLNNIALFSSTGNSSPFDIEANGYVRAEAAGVLFLQRKQYARRIYANIIHSTTNCDGFKEEGATSPSTVQQIQLYKQLYDEIDMDPNLISYIESHGTGTPVGDVVEGTSIEEFFCMNRTTPLKIGSLKSNMGHAEAASALCSMVKMIIAFETGFIPPNIRFNTPNPNIKGLLNGHLEVVTKLTPLEGEYFALNAFGAGGSNAHVLISPNNKVKRTDESLKERLPWLITASGRTEEAVECILKNVDQNQDDAEYVRLWHEIFKNDINGHLYRGYTILQKNEAARMSKKNFSGEKRPIWFVFNGMGSQWSGMGKSLMKIPIFAQSIQRSHEVLQSKGLDLVKIITDDDPKMFDNILNTFVGITAIQIGLVDVLRILHIKPDGIVGHSLGEIGSAYADGCFTADQTILVSYYRGLISLETDFIHGTMAAVGKSYQDMKNLVPLKIDIACHNGPSSCTISGPTQIMQNFIKNLSEEKIFVREVYSSNIAYHSRYIASAGPKLIPYLKTVIPEPKLRSEKWICTSALEREWHSDKVKYSSAEYHTNNLLNPVLFEESYQYIPKNAITIEIGPHCLLNAILKRSFPTTVDNLPLTMRNHENNVEYLLNALGRLYEMGCDMELSHLYPPIDYPVSKSTPMISPLIKWKHDERLEMDETHSEGVSQSTERKFVCDPNYERNAYISNHIIDGRNLYPGFGYLWLVVETVSMMNNKKVTDVSVVFENVRFEHALIIRDKGMINFNVSVHRLNLGFEVIGNGSVVATGKVRVLENARKEMLNILPCGGHIYSDTLQMSKNDFYRELRLRGYNYEGLFKSVEVVNCDAKFGEISWNNNFVCFMDAMAQISLLHMDCRGLLVPTHIRKVVIDFEQHFKILDSMDKENPKFSVHFYPRHGVVRSGGIQITDLQASEITRQKNQAEPRHETYQFIPYISEEAMDLYSTVEICSQIIVKSIHSLKTITYELLDQEFDPELAIISSATAAALNDMASIEPNVNVLINSEEMEEITMPDGIIVSNKKLPKDKSASLIIVSNIQNKTDLFESIFDALKDEGFIITTVSIDKNISFENLGFNVCFSRIINDSEKIVLLNKITEPKPVKQVVQIKNDTYSWVDEIKKYVSSNPNQGVDNKLVIFSEKEPTNGILGFFNCLKHEQKGLDISCFSIMDDNAPAFTLDNLFYKSQLHKNLRYNIYKNGEWGSYWHVALDTNTEVESSHAFGTLKERGNLSSFEWVQGALDPLTYENSKGRKLVHVYYSGVNFKDIMLAVGKLSPVDSVFYSRFVESYLGTEYSGKNENGERVMGLIRHTGIATMLESKPSLVYRIPDSMTLEEAASIPIAYSTVIYAFFIRMQLKEGCSILIHSGSGGIGQAAINICLHYRCNIFTTVGTPEKAEFIKKTFPQIPESHIGNSRDTSFLEMIMERTDGKGVDVVLNSLTEDKLRASILCVADGGQFLEIGKFDVAENNHLELGHFVNNISFDSVQLDKFEVNTEDEEETTELQNKLQEMLDQGIVKPISRTVFQINEVESAFRYMASGKHIGKLVIKIRDEEQDPKTKPTLMRMKANSRFYCLENKSYVILGGLGGFGMELADWLIIRGARNIVLSSRTGIKNGYQSYRIQLWRSYGANVVISTSDIFQESGVKEILETANALGPVAGIFNLAMVLMDEELANQTEETFRTVVNPKAIATAHFDQLSRKMCPHLEHFIVFSSLVSGYGNANQTNYGFANSIVERICELRNANNLPGMAIQWGLVGDVGYFSDSTENNPSAVRRGYAQQNIKSCLDTINRFMASPNPIVSASLIAEKRKIVSDIITTVANLLGIKDLKAISLTWTLAELGMDSILALELKQILESEFSIFLTPEDLRTSTFAKLQRLKEEKENTPNLNANEVTTPLQYFTNKKLLNQPILRIPIMNGEAQEQLPINENPTVFAFPGIEGFSLVMEPLAKNLPMQTLCFQYQLFERYNSVQKLCEYFSSYILKELRPENEFYLIGHSVGTMFAIEVAEILEKQGRKGRIWLIDGSPTTAQWTFVKKIQEIGSEKFDEITQNQICEIIITIILPELPKETYLKKLENASDWESKKKISLSILSKITKSEKIDHQLFDICYNMIKVISQHKKLPSFSLQSPCVLIRCVESYSDFPLDESYGLTQYFRNPVVVHKIDDANHSSILSHPKTTDIIMNSLS